MKFLTAGLIAVWALIGANSAALTLTVQSQPVIPGPSEVTDAHWLPQDRKVICLGQRLLLLNATNEVERLIPLSTSCEHFAVNPGGLLAVTTGPAGRLSLWSLTSGARLRTLTLPESPVGLGFRKENELLLAFPSGLQRLSTNGGPMQPLLSGPLRAFFLSADGQRAVLADRLGQRDRLRLVDTQQFQTLSALLCDAPCTPKAVNFSVDGRTATLFTSGTLHALREGWPSSAILRQAEEAGGLPLPDGHVLTVHGGIAELRDLQTGRREQTLHTGEIEVSPLRLSSEGRVLAVSGGGELLDADSTFADIRLVQLPARVTSGGIDDSTGELISRLKDGSGRLGQKPLPTALWAVQTMNRSTWALVPDAQGGLRLTEWRSGQWRSYSSPASHQWLSVNFWGNHAVTWDEDSLQVVSQASGKITSTFHPAPGSLKDASITLSPDATRAFVFPGRGEPYLVFLQSGNRVALPLSPAGGRYVGLQISGKGVLAFVSSRDNLTLYRPNEKMPYAVVEARGEQARFSNDSLFLATPANTPDGPCVHLVNVQTGRVEASTPILSGLPAFITWSADDRHLVIGAGLMDALNSVTVFEMK